MIIDQISINRNFGTQKYSQQTMRLNKRKLSFLLKKKKSDFQSYNKYISNS